MLIIMNNRIIDKHEKLLRKYIDHSINLTNSYYWMYQNKEYDIYTQCESYTNYLKQKRKTELYFFFLNLHLRNVVPDYKNQDKLFYSVEDAARMKAKIHGLDFYLVLAKLENDFDRYISLTNFSKVNADYFNKEGFL